MSFKLTYFSHNSIKAFVHRSDIILNEKKTDYCYNVHVVEGGTVEIVAAVGRVWPLLVDELPDAEHGGEEDPVAFHPVEIHVEGDGGAAERPEVVMRVHDAEEAVVGVVQVPADVVVLVADAEAGQRPPPLQTTGAAAQEQKDRGQQN